jgi:hypothetical protein
MAGLIWFNFWGFNPISKVVNQQLTISGETIRKLNAYKTTAKFVDLPGVNNSAERERLTLVLNGLIENLITGIRDHPNKLWVMKQFQVALEAVQKEDTEAQESFGTELEKLMGILGIKSSEGLINFYRYGYLLTYVLPNKI